jgi:hypothetical protein
MEIQLFINLFDGTIRKYNVSNNTTINDLLKLINKTNNIENKIKIKNATQLLKNDLTLLEQNIKNNDTLYLYTPVNGGFIDLLIDLVIGMADLFKNIGTLIEDIVRVIVNILELAPVIFSPDKLLNDVIYGSITGITSMITAIFENLSNLFGDSVPKKEDGTGGVFGIEDKKKAVCIKPTIINLIILIVCPPLALYINKGWRSIFMIIVCGLMTYYMYYFPGFLFAALHILC